MLHDISAVMQEVSLIVRFVKKVKADGFTSVTCGCQHMRLIHTTDLKSKIKKKWNKIKF